MKNEEKKIADDILRYGTIHGDLESECEGIAVREYLIEYDGNKYDLVKNNGEWVSVRRI